MEREEKLKALDAALVQIEKQYGKGAVMKLTEVSDNFVELTEVFYLNHH